MKRRLFRRVRIARVPFVIGEVIAYGAPELVGPWLGEDLDTAEAQLVVLRRKRVLVDADLANRFLGRQFAATEPVDVDGPAIRPRGRPGEGLKVPARSSGLSESALRSDPLITTALALLDASVLTVGPPFSATVTSCFSMATLSSRFSV